jgi:hypothetical protein
MYLRAHHAFSSPCLVFPLEDDNDSDLSDSSSAQTPPYVCTTKHNHRSPLPHHTTSSSVFDTMSLLPSVSLLNAQRSSLTPHYQSRRWTTKPGSNDTQRQSTTVNGEPAAAAAGGARRVSGPRYVSFPFHLFYSNITVYLDYVTFTSTKDDEGQDHQQQQGGSRRDTSRSLVHFVLFYSNTTVYWTMLCLRQRTTTTKNKTSPGYVPFSITFILFSSFRWRNDFKVTYCRSTSQNSTQCPSLCEPSKFISNPM